jgi:electron transfer flavoprotein beta subunit
MAMGLDRAILLETEEEWGPIPTAEAIVAAIEAEREGGNDFDLFLFGNEAADTGDYQVGVRVAHALDLPCVTGIKDLSIEDGVATAKREVGGGWEIYEVALPAVFTVKEGINLPRYPSLPGKLKAKRKPIEQIEPQRNGVGGLEKIALQAPKEEEGGAVILGEGPEAAPKAVAILREMGAI